MRGCDRFSERQRVRAVDRGVEPDGRVVALAGPQQHGPAPQRVGVSTDGGRLASAGWDHTIRLWNLATAEQIDALPVDANVVTALSISSDDRYLAWIGEDRFGAWDLHSKSQVIPNESRPKPPAASVRCFDFVADASILPLPWTLDAHGVTVWDVSSNTLRDWSVEELRGHRARFLGVRGRYAVGINPGTMIDDVRTARGDSGSSITVVDLVRGEGVRLPEFSGPFALCPRKGPTTLLAARRANDLTRLEVWDLDRRQLVGPLIGHTDNVYAIAYSPDGKRIATGGRDSLRLWDAETLTEIVQLRGHTSFIWSLAFSPDGRRLVSGSGDNTARIWDTASDDSG